MITWYLSNGSVSGSLNLVLRNFPGGNGDVCGDSGCTRLSITFNAETGCSGVSMIHDLELFSDRSKKFGACS